MMTKNNISEISLSIPMLTASKSLNKPATKPATSVDHIYNSMVHTPVNLPIKPDENLVLGKRKRNDTADLKIGNLTAKIERISSEGDENAGLKEKFRISSRDWFKDFDQEVNLGTMDPSLFMGNVDYPDVPTQTRPLPDPTGSSEWLHGGCPAPFASSNNQALPMRSFPSPVALTSSAASVEPGASRKKKKRRKRMIDETRSVVSTAGDVLFGRGGLTNRHPGNIRFRQKALELRPWYELSTKDQKQRIADVLVESVTSAGNRFLERGTDGLWHEVIGNGAHRKASQALRERIKTGKRKSE